MSIIDDWEQPKERCVTCGRPLMVHWRGRPCLVQSPATLAKNRPGNYEQLSPREQWEIDKELGILDWDGKD